jgi:hypothetical protein
MLWEFSVIARRPQADEAIHSLDCFAALAMTATENKNVR